jgi:acyl-CoA synthetase (AMP-forming)/AMP-acid ligase II
MNVAELLSRQAQARGDAAAIIEARRDRAVSFAELEAAGEAAAASFVSAGLRPGDAVLVFHPMGIELYAALAGMLRAGLVAAFVDPANGRAFIERCCERLRPAALFASPRAHAMRLVSPAVRAIPKRFSTIDLPGATRLGKRPARYHIVVRGPGDPALITFTSGSTGAPKAAVRSHGMLAAQLTALSASLRLTEGDVDTSTMPIVLLANLAAGVTSLIPDVDLARPGAIDAARLAEDMRRNDASSIVASPALLERLAAHCASTGHVLAGIRKIFAGGAPVFPSSFDRIAGIAPAARVTAVYGSTEAEPIADLERADIAAQDREAMRAGAGLLAGRPVNSIDVRILANRWGSPLPPMSRETFERMCLPAVAAGEIVVSGPHVLSGYLGGVGDAQTKFRVDDCVWHRTGDLGVRDAEGRLWLLGRCVAQVNDERGALFPFAVECAANGVGSIARCAVAAGGGRRMLFVEPAPGGAPDLDSLRRSLAWAQLDEIAMIPRIPVDRRHNAKTDYAALERIVARRVARSRRV